MQYDYVVVGGGSAGATLAARLSDDPTVSVALLEAGGSPDDPMFTVPALWPQQLTSDADWGYLSEPEPQLQDRRVYLPRGRSLGGTSSLNAMVYIRGVADDYNRWAAHGAVGWDWDNVLPYFLAVEDNERGPSAYHGHGGPLRVQDRRSDSRVVAAWVDAAVAAGIPHNDDFNGPSQDGAGFFQVTMRDGERCSSYRAFLQPVLGRPNLTVITHAHATRIRIEDRRATGVEYDQLGEAHFISALREVVLCAGAYASPQLLLLSGIGPAHQLAHHKIPLLEDLPVGENLQDHFGAATVVATTERPIPTDPAEADWDQYNADGRGALTSNIVEAGAFIRVDDSAASPDVEMCVLAAGWSEDGLGDDKGPAIGVWTEVLRGTSRGSVTLRTKQPTARPRIRHDFFRTEEDRHRLIEGVKANVEILRQAPLRDYVVGDLQMPASTSTHDVEQFIRRVGTSLYHPSSTCAIGAVVDAELKVYGIDALRVADASIMPTLVSGNPNAPIIMIGTRAADLITATRHTETAGARTA